MQLGPLLFKGHNFFLCFVQAHLAGIFDNVNKVEFHPKDYDRILSVISREEEQIQVSSFRFFFFLTLDIGYCVT